MPNECGGGKSSFARAGQCGWELLTRPDLSVNHTNRASLLLTLLASAKYQIRLSRINLVESIVGCLHNFERIFMSRILLVDDERNILNALQRELKDDYEVEAFSSPVEALIRCNNASFDLVISDYKMPEMDGVTFLRKLGNIQPDAARLLLSGQVDIDALVSAINETHIFRFLVKPWDKIELKNSIEQALAFRKVILDTRQEAYFYNLTHDLRKHVETSEKLYRIILVDSDETLLAVMKRGLVQDDHYDGVSGAIHHEIIPGGPDATHKFRFEVETFNAANAALEYAGQHDFDLVITAQTLPDMDGIHLLGNLQKIRPDAARILSSSNPNKELLSQAINEAHVYSFLCLYWNTSELKADIRRQVWNIHKLRTIVIQALISRNLLLENRRLAALQKKA